MKKNVPDQHVNMTLLAVDGGAVSTGTTTVFVTGDNGTRTAGAGTVTNKGLGDWDYAPTQAETNYDHVKFTFENAFAFKVGINIYPDAGADQTGDSYAVVNSRLPAALTGGKMDSDTTSVAGSTEGATNLARGAEQLQPFTVGAGASSTSVPTDITGAPYTNANHFAGANCYINKERRTITGSGGSPVVLTTDAFSSTPSQNDLGVIA